MVTPPNPTEFNPVVWTIVQQVPYGVVSTYGQIASIIPTPDGIDDADFKRLGPKWVGDALNAISYPDMDGKPVQPGIPWWRIINSKGGISMPRGSNAAQEQRTRLAAEEVTFDARGLVNLDQFGWEGPPDAFLQLHGFIKPKSLRKPDSPTQMSLF